MSLEALMTDAKRRMDQAVEKVAEDFAGIRTGRANPQLLNRVLVDYYGSPTPLQQLANFSVPEPRILVVNPFDRGSVDQIEKAIRDADLGLNPSSDGTTIRCVFPELTEERRRDYIKMAKAAAEEGRVAIRNIRRHTRDAMQKLEDDGDVGADERERYTKQLEELTAAHVAKVDKALESKEQELLDV
ncbi:MAG: ribosome recycling factor [Nitriliruptoraceae bacterium]